MLSIRKTNDGTTQMYLHDELVYEHLNPDNAFIKTSLEKISELKCSELPDKLKIDMGLDKYYEELFNEIGVLRNENKIEFELCAILNLKSVKNRMSWTIWNPYLLMQKANSMAAEQQMESHIIDSDDTLGIVFNFSFPATGTLGEIFNRSLAKVKIIMDTVKEQLLQQALKEQKK